jgi:hypothetical protein
LVSAHTSARNGIGISQPTHTGKASSSLKPNSNLETALLASFSDEDDNAERAAILQSPVKGVKRLSSEVIDSFCLGHGLIYALGYCQGRKTFVLGKRSKKEPSKGNHLGFSDGIRMDYLGCTDLHLLVSF